jgi:hypothetical protein
MDEERTGKERKPLLDREETTTPKHPRIAYPMCVSLCNPIGFNHFGEQSAMTVFHH